MISARNLVRQQEQGQITMGNSLKSATFLIESRLADAAMGDPDALYELGVAYSTGTSGIEVDLVEAHKWFNLAALNGSSRGQECRAEISRGNDRPRDRRSPAPGPGLARRTGGAPPGAAGRLTDCRHPGPSTPPAAALRINCGRDVG